MSIIIQCNNIITSKSIRLSIDKKTKISELCSFLVFEEFISCNDAARPFLDWWVCRESSQHNRLDYFSSLEELQITDGETLLFMVRDSFFVKCHYKGYTYNVKAYEDESKYKVLDRLRKEYDLHDCSYIEIMKCPPSYPYVYKGAELKVYDVSPYDGDACLYGCPNADELIGLLPDCMLTDFDGIVSEEL